MQFILLPAPPPIFKLLLNFILELQHLLNYSCYNISEQLTNHID